MVVFLFNVAVSGKFQRGYSASVVAGGAVAAAFSVL